MFLIKRPHAEETVRKALDDPPNPYRKKQHASASDHPSGLISERPAHGPLPLFRSLAEGRVSSDLEAGFHNTLATHRMLALGTPIVPQPYWFQHFSFNHTKGNGRRSFHQTIRDAQFHGTADLGK
jgi:hypothetical protein